jgi:hypothetical protein
MAQLKIGDLKNTSEGHIFDGKSWRKVGTVLPPVFDKGHLGAIVGATDEVPLVPEDKWRTIQPADIAQVTPPIKDQGGTSQCVAFGWSSMMEASLLLQGLPAPRFSPPNLYTRICGGRDAGASPDKAAQELLLNGLATKAYLGIDDLAWNRGCPSGWTNDPDLTFAGEIAYAGGFKEIVSAIMLGFVCGISIDCGRVFSPQNDLIPGVKGVIPDKRGSGGGHWMFAIGFDWLGEAKEPHLLVCNSWSPQWGVDGLCWLNETYSPEGICLRWAKKRV